MKYNPKIHNRRSIRLKGYDYSRAGAYFITICCKDKACLFGDIKNGEMFLNEYGQIARNEWLKTPEIRHNVELDVFVVMPNHMHGIVVLTDDGRGVSHTSELCMSKFYIPGSDTSSISEISTFGIFDTPLRSPSGNIGAIVRGYKSAVTKQLNLLNIDCVVWQRNYHEHIIRNAESYQKISDYIINNPLLWNEDKFFRRDV